MELNNDAIIVNNNENISNTIITEINEGIMGEGDFMLLFDQENSPNKLLSIKLTKRVIFAFIRLIVIGLCLWHNSIMTRTLYGLIVLLLFHETIVVSNYIVFKLILLYNKYSQNKSLEQITFPKIISYIDIFSNIVFFNFFIYSLYFISFNQKEADFVLKNNSFLLYFFIFLTVLSFFNYSKTTVFLVFLMPLYFFIVYSIVE